MADTLDVLTLDEAKAAVANNAGTNNDTLLESYITGVSRFLDTICGPIVKREITAEALTASGGSVFLPTWPVDSVTTITEYTGTTSLVLTADALGSAPADAYTADLAAGILYRRKGGYDSQWASGRANIVVTYIAGRFADTATVDERFKRAAGITLANLWRREQGMGVQLADGFIAMGATYALPDAAKALLVGELQVRVR
jgi:hypothetical protein